MRCATCSRAFRPRSRAEHPEAAWATAFSALRDVISRIRDENFSQIAGLELAFGDRRGYVHAAKAVIPPIGKLVEVQAKVGKQWRTVGEAFRTDALGNFSLKYRFRKFYTQPTRFKFRLKVLPEAGWPYSQPVYSAKRKVKVIPHHG